ncbi:GNAT family N-acetyltransferase [Nonomuraea sp. NPDC049028]|uniref:GNAT family N-acetyltransferase n=1 Tax=Nonomuraea sp. NPDC049028 TaxID=3364348 RepID=UPI003712614A
MIELQELSADDWALWRELRLVALEEAPYAFGVPLSEWQGDGDREERWRDRLSIPGSRNLIALLDGKPAGMASGIPGERDGVTELISMWVVPEARGRGVGDHLIRAVAAWAVEVGAEVLELAVAPFNDKAIALYRRHGFEDTSQLGDELPNGLRELVMAKKLAIRGDADD